jgi:tripartite-type tricarboxylate transporter receptor subunit TctC
MFNKLKLVSALVLGSALIAAPAMAQDFPKKQPIKVVVGANAGGLTDVIARITAEFLQRRIGQAVVVENRPGAASAIAADYTAKSPADGYTLYLAGAEMTVIPALRSNLPYKFEDFTYLTKFWTTIPMMVVSPKMPESIKTPKDLIAYMKANPGKVRYGTPGVGSLNHVGTAMFEASTGVKGVHVPYTGIAPIYTDLLAGNLDMAMGATPPFPDELRVLGPSGTRRHSAPVYAGLPTLAEQGFKDASHDAWFAFVAPPNLPKPIADKLTTELLAVFKDPEAKAKYLAATKDAPDASPLVGEAFKKYALEQNKAWKAVADREKIVVQQ